MAGRSAERGVGIMVGCGDCGRLREIAGDCGESAGWRINSRENSGIRANFAGTPNRIVGIMRFTKSGWWEFSIKSAQTR